MNDQPSNDVIIRFTQNDTVVDDRSGLGTLPRIRALLRDFDAADITVKTGCQCSKHADGTHDVHD